MCAHKVSANRTSALKSHIKYDATRPFAMLQPWIRNEEPNKKAVDDTKTFGAY